MVLTYAGNATRPAVDLSGRRRADLPQSPGPTKTSCSIPNGFSHALRERQLGDPNWKETATPRRAKPIFWGSVARRNRSLSG